MPPARTHFCAVVAARVRALFQTGEDVLELHHARIGEHQRRVVARHQWRTRHDLVPLAREKPRKFDLISLTPLMARNSLAVQVFPVQETQRQTANCG